MLYGAWVKTIEHLEKNRPVHLALRDVYYERAVELLKDPGLMAAQELETARFEEILFLLRTAREHGYAAVRKDANTEKDSQFHMFINMLAGNVKAVLSMLNLKHSVEVEGSFFFSFLEANRASVALQAEEYERRARDITRCVLKTLELAQEAFEQLKQGNHGEFTDPERERYAKAAEHHRKLIEQQLDIPTYRKRAGRYA
jgi:hypothetical protein